MPVALIGTLILTGCTTTDSNSPVEGTSASPSPAPNVLYIHDAEQSAKGAVSALNEWLRTHPSKQIRGLASVALNRQTGLSGIEVIIGDGNNTGEICGAVNVYNNFDSGHGTASAASVQGWIDTHTHSKILTFTGEPDVGGGSAQYILCAQ